MKLFNFKADCEKIELSILGIKIKHKLDKQVPIHYQSYSQLGEDKTIDFYMYYYTDIDRENVKYVDIGMNHPIYCNNTYLFYKKGGNGILIEPNSVHCETARELRPNDYVINAGIKFDQKDEAIYYNFKNTSGLNTFDKTRADRLIKDGYELLEEKTIPLYDINAVLANKFENNQIDFMSIDVEGVDELILKSINFDIYKPTFICIEANKSSVGSREKDFIINYLDKHNYLLLADNTINYIFINRDKLILGRYK